MSAAHDSSSKGKGGRPGDERLADWVDGQMGPKELERFEAELRVNKGLRERAESYRATVEAVRDALSRDTLSRDALSRDALSVDEPAAEHPSQGERVDLADRIMAQIHGGGKATDVAASRPAPVLRFRPALFSAIAAVLIAAVFLWAKGQGDAPLAIETDTAVGGESAAQNPNRRPAESQDVLVLREQARAGRRLGGAPKADAGEPARMMEPEAESNGGVEESLEIGEMELQGGLTSALPTGSPKRGTQKAPSPAGPTAPAGPATGNPASDGEAGPGGRKGMEIPSVGGGAGGNLTRPKTPGPSSATTGSPPAEQPQAEELDDNEDPIEAEAARVRARVLARLMGSLGDQQLPQPTDRFREATPEEPAVAEVSELGAGDPAWVADLRSRLTEQLPRMRLEDSRTRTAQPKDIGGTKAVTLDQSAPDDAAGESGSWASKNSGDALPFVVLSFKLPAAASRDRRTDPDQSLESATIAATEKVLWEDLQLRTLLRRQRAGDPDSQVRANSNFAGGAEFAYPVDAPVSNGVVAVLQPLSVDALRTVPGPVTPPSTTEAAPAGEPGTPPASQRGSAPLSAWLASGPPDQLGQLLSQVGAWAAARGGRLAIGEIPRRDAEAWAQLSRVQAPAQGFTGGNYKLTERVGERSVLVVFRFER